MGCVSYVPCVLPVELSSNEFTSIRKRTIFYHARFLCFGYLLLFLSDMDNNTNVCVLRLIIFELPKYCVFKRKTLY